MWGMVGAFRLAHCNIVETNQIFNTTHVAFANAMRMQTRIVTYFGEG
jgi:hypothetical protein